MKYKDRERNWRDLRPTMSVFTPKNLHLAVVVDFANIAMTHQSFPDDGRLRLNTEGGKIGTGDRAAF
jgi:hypothetical protein